jgi:hypothetical protein
VQGKKRLGLEADYLPPSSAEGENEWSCTSNPLYVCMAWFLIKHSDIVTILLYQATGVLFCIAEIQEK